MYRVNNIDGFDYNTFVRCLKAKFTLEQLDEQVLNVDVEPIKEMWEDIVPITIEEGLKETNIEKRRAIFSCLNPVDYLDKVGKVIDKQTITKKQIRWDKNNKPYEYVFEDTYSLYELKFLSSNDSFSWQLTYAVKCLCTTTSREYVIFVPGWIQKDVISAIAWTLRIPTFVTVDNNKTLTKETHIEKIVRQGDVLIVKWAIDCLPCLDHYRSLTKEEYIKLITTET